MAFHIDCKGRHGLVSIDKKPASYPGWQCDACKRQIEHNCIGVLHCAICTIDICPACWTNILPKIVNAAGYPCFWVDSMLYGDRSWHVPQGPSSILVCHRPDDLLECRCGMFISACRHQCRECLTLTRTMQLGASVTSAARVVPSVPEAPPPVAHAPGLHPIPPGWHEPTSRPLVTFMASHTSGRVGSYAYPPVPQAPPPNRHQSMFSLMMSPQSVSAGPANVFSAPPPAAPPFAAPPPANVFSAPPPAAPPFAAPPPANVFSAPF